MRYILYILLAAVFTDNAVLVKFLGVCPLVGTTGSKRSALLMSASAALVMIVSSAASYTVYYGVLVPLSAQYLETVVFVFITALVVQVLEKLLQAFFPEAHRLLGIYLPLLAANCAVMGLCLINIDESFSFAEAMFNAAGTAAGFALALLIFAGIREKLYGSDIPECFKGLASTLVAAGIVSLAFMGFDGIAASLFV